MYNAWEVKIVVKDFACFRNGGAGRFPDAE